MTVIPFNPQRLRQLCLGKTNRLLAGQYGFGAVISATSKIYQDMSDQPYVYIDNGANILAVAHCDTVDHSPTFSKAILGGMVCYFSPAMDDRLGVYTILDVLPLLGLKYDVLLTTNEERGMSTARNFKPIKQYNWMFEFDRRGTGAVFYQYNQTQLRKEAEKYLRHDFGSFSDISVLDHLGCAGINVGTGYDFEHTYYCHMILPDWKEQVLRFVALFRDHKDIFYPYAPKQDDRFGYYPSYSSTSATSTTPRIRVIPASNRYEVPPEFVKDWLKTFDKMPQIEENNPGLLDFIDDLPSAVWQWIDEAWVADRDPGHPQTECKWWNWWLRTNWIQAMGLEAPIEPKRIDPHKLTTDEVIALHDSYIQGRKQFTTTELRTCEECGREVAEFYKDGGFVCGQCDDMLWYSALYAGEMIDDTGN